MRIRRPPEAPPRDWRVLTVWIKGRPQSVEDVLMTLWAWDVFLGWIPMFKTLLALILIFEFLI